MADLSNGSGVFQTYNNTGTGVAELGDNKSVNTNGNGIAGRTVIVSVVGSGGNVSQTELEGTINEITTASAAGGGVSAADAFVVVGVAGTIASGTMYLALQGTGTVGTDANDYFSGVTVAVVANFPGLSG
jgi:hypothetical protein